MRMLWDVVCIDCGHKETIWYDKEGSKDTLEGCPECGSKHRKLALGGQKSYAAKEPYDYLDSRPPDGKRIFSGPKVSSKTTT